MNNCLVFVGVVIVAWGAGIILVLAGLRNISRHNAEHEDDGKDDQSP